MWDEDALAKLGLGADPSDVSVEAPKASLAVGVETAAPHETIARGPSAAGSAATGSATTGSGGSLRGWVATLALAVGLGVAVYFAVRALR